MCNFADCRVVIGYILFLPLITPFFIFKYLDDCIKKSDEN